MNIIKKLSLLVLVGFGFCQAGQTNPTLESLKKAFEVLDKGMSSDLANCVKQCSGKNLSHEQMVEAIKKEAPAIAKKCADIMKHELSIEQREALADIIRNLHEIAKFCAEDLIGAAHALDSYEKRQAMNQVAEKLAPKLDVNENSTYAQMIAWAKEYEKIDLLDKDFNVCKKYFCRCSYLNDFAMIMSEHRDNKTRLYDCLAVLSDAIAAPFVVINDFYYFPGWQESFKRSAQTFELTRIVTTQLLKELAA